MIRQPNSSILVFQLDISNAAQQELTVNVVDRNYGIIDSRMVSSATYYVRFDFSNVADGDYYIEINSGKEKIKKEIRISTIVKETRTAAIAAQKKRLAF